MKLFKIFLGIAIITSFAWGCAATKKAIGEREVIDKSGDRPDWYTKIPKLKDGKLFFRGSRTRALAYEDGLTDARMDAMRQVGEKIQTIVHTSYEKARVEYGIPQDDKDAGRDLEDGIIAQAKAAVTGVQEEDAFWEKYKEIGGSGISYFYDVAVLMSLTQQDFERSLANTLSGALEKKREAKNKKAEEVLNRMRQDVGSAVETGTEE
ncbi:MAG TPA: hypothetical protein VII00_01315 [bacterium]